MLSETFIYENSHRPNRPNRLDWGRISRYQKLSNKLMVDFMDLIDWRYAVRYQVIDEAVLSKYLARFNIYELCNNVDWYAIMRYQKVSAKFVDHYAYYNAL